MSAIDTASLVMAQAAAPEGGALMGMLPIILMFVILYFLMIRPQMKRQKEHRNLIAALAKGDEVVTAGGMLGKVTKVNDSYVTVEVSELAEARRDHHAEVLGLGRAAQGNHQGPVRVTWCCAGPAGPAATPDSARRPRRADHPDMK